jgi:hypothetical protein
MTSKDIIFQLDTTWLESTINNYLKEVTLGTVLKMFMLTQTSETKLVNQSI